jgi:hypothetical protein
MFDIRMCKIVAPIVLVLVAIAASGCSNTSKPNSPMTTFNIGNGKGATGSIKDPRAAAESFL